MEKVQFLIKRRTSVYSRKPPFRVTTDLGCRRLKEASFYGKVSFRLTYHWTTVGESGRVRFAPFCGITKLFRTTQSPDTDIM